MCLIPYVIISCIDQLLAATRGGRGEIWVSYLQIYCEVISDLLNPYQNDGSAGGEQDCALRGQIAQLSIRERSGTVFVDGLSRSRINRVEDLNELLKLGDMNRSTAATNFNEASSRSHAALMITVLMNEESDSGGAPVSGQGNAGAAVTGGDRRMVRESTLVLVDLAGSERYVA